MLLNLHNFTYIRFCSYFPEKLAVAMGDSDSDSSASTDSQMGTIKRKPRLADNVESRDMSISILSGSGGGSGGGARPKFPPPVPVRKTSALTAVQLSPVHGGEGQYQNLEELREERRKLDLCDNLESTTNISAGKLVEENLINKGVALNLCPIFENTVPTSDKNLPQNGKALLPQSNDTVYKTDAITISPLQQVAVEIPNIANKAVVVAPKKIKSPIEKPDINLRGLVSSPGVHNQGVQHGVAKEVAKAAPLTTAIKGIVKKEPMPLPVKQQKGAIAATQPPASLTLYTKAISAGETEIVSNIPTAVPRKVAKTVSFNLKEANHVQKAVANGGVKTSDDASKHAAKNSAAKKCEETEIY